MSRRINLSNIYSYIFNDLPLFLLAFNYIFYNALPYADYKNYLRIIALTLFLIGWLITGPYRISKIELICLAIVGFELIINGSLAINLTALVGYAILSKRNIDEDINRMFYICFILCFILLILISLGLVSNTTYISTMGRSRSTLGFNNPNVAALFYSTIVYLYLLSRKTITYKHLILSSILTIVVFYFTDSRTSFVSLSLFIIIITLTNLKTTRIEFLIKKIAVVFIDSICVLNLISIFFINKFMKYDVLTSYRLSSFQMMINEAGLTGLLFGGTNYSVDSFYYMFIFSYGLIAFVLFMIIVHFSVNQLIATNNYRMLAFLFAVFIGGMMESSIIRPELLSTLLVWKTIIKPQTLEVISG